MADMGLGEIGTRNDLVFKRKFRWTFTVLTGCSGTIPEHFVKLASRPNISVEETEINFRHGKTWIPGKGTWETITVTYYDVNQTDNLDLYSWLATVYDFTDPVGLKQASKRSEYGAVGTLTLFDGCGSPMERWEMEGMWPTTINFGDLDYSNSEEVTIELTLRYDQVKYTPICPAGGIAPCCTPCNSGS